MKTSHSLLIGHNMAEKIKKIGIGSAAPLEQELEMTVKGLDQVSGLPKKVSVTSEEVREALQRTRLSDCRRHQNHP